ncbi:MAG: hypothetical protein ISN26_06845 [Betaproteobacteria bacterium AqS2]|uniref:Uncharacterized protein n=1 Tax=Candidatus Amphirhobacter heronislandensis TaxID=1732024 RepID=A0A930UD95_9GAMM|nr:hypothetical protein [Betaproteobacteria bacterium AqS2]
MSKNEKYGPPPNYAVLEILEWAKARDAVQGEARASSSRLMRVVNTFSNKFKYPVPEVLEKIYADEMFAAHFAKDPLRTGLHEKEAARWLQSLPWITDFEKLPSGGEKSLKISGDGNIEAAVKGKNLPGKSLDFKWRTSGKTFYAMHKYIKEGGGHQDNQHHEMIELLKRFMQCQTDNVVLLVIADGAYYQANNKQRLTELRQYVRDKAPRSHALPIDEVPDLLEKYSSEQVVVP